MGVDETTRVRNFHQAKWDEPIIFELSTEGERGVIVPEVEEDIERTVGDGVSKLPPAWQEDKLLRFQKWPR